MLHNSDAELQCAEALFSLAVFCCPLALSQAVTVHCGSNLQHIENTRSFLQTHLSTLKCHTGGCRCIQIMTRWWPDGDASKSPPTLHTAVARTHRNTFIWNQMTRNRNDQNLDSGQACRQQAGQVGWMGHSATVRCSTHPACFQNRHNLSPSQQAAPHQPAARCAAVGAQTHSLRAAYTTTQAQHQRRN